MPDIIYPRITVVTPSFNQASFLPRTIESVLNQQYPNLEYIIMDGGSTDESVAVINRYQDQLAYWVSGPDGGAANALNTAFQRATGDIFAYLNSDDELIPGALFQVAHYFMENPKTTIVYGDLAFVDAEGNPVRYPRSTIYKPTFMPRRMMASGINTIPQQSAFWRRTIFEQVGGFNAKNFTCWDGEFFTDAAIAGAVFRYMPLTLARFRIHGSSISGSGRLTVQYRKDRAEYMKKYSLAGLSPSHLETLFWHGWHRFKRLVRELAWQFERART